MSKFIALTGAAGFLGRVVLRELLKRGDFVYGVDSLTYAADPEYIALVKKMYPEQFSFVASDVRSLGRLPDVDAVIHMAAETHVDNSLNDGPNFVGTNVGGTVAMLELTRAKAQHGMPHFIHISTDEVYGSLAEGAADESSPLCPSSPYAASKAAADLCVEAWGQTYGVPYTILRPTNCYGSNQHPEKLIPKTIRSTVLGRPMTIHGDGSQTRCWLRADDLASAILLVVDQRLTGIYNVGGNTEASVKDVVSRIGCLLDSTHPPVFGHKRPAMDLRYAVDDSALRQAGWTPTGDFWSDLVELVEDGKSNLRF